MSKNPDEDTDPEFAEDADQSSPEEEGGGVVEERDEVEFPPQFAELIDPDAPPEVIERVISAAMMYAGPLPPPHMLRQYDEVQPGFADRIVKMAEKEQSIRGRDNSHLLWNDSGRVVGSVIVSLTLVGAAIYSAASGYVALAIALASVGAVPQVIRFFNSRK